MTVYVPFFCIRGLRNFVLLQEFVGYLKSKSEKNGYGFIVCGEIQAKSTVFSM